MPQEYSKMICRKMKPELFYKGGSSQDINEALFKKYNASDVLEKILLTSEF